jgi:hypothetical protein
MAKTRERCERSDPVPPRACEPLHLRTCRAGQGAVGTIGVALELGGGTSGVVGKAGAGPQSHAPKPLPSAKQVCPPLHAPAPTHSRV